MLNKVATPLAIIGVAIDSYRIGSSACEDYEKGSTRNTTKTVATVAGGWGGGYGGVISGETCFKYSKIRYKTIANLTVAFLNFNFPGAAIGSAVVPGLGTLVGAIIGGFTGGIGGSIVAEKLVEKVADTMEYDVEVLLCKNCKMQFKCKIYVTGRLELCPKCTEKKREENNNDFDGKDDEDTDKRDKPSHQKLHRSVLKESSSFEDSDDQDYTPVSDLHLPD